LISNLRGDSPGGALAALARITQPSIPGNWFPALYTITVLGCLYGAIMWVASRMKFLGGRTGC